MADYVAHSNTDGGAATTSIVLTKPTGTAENDIIFALLKRADPTDPSAVPSGWAQVSGSAKNTDSGFIAHWLYYKVAGGSEGADYTWTWAAGARSGGTIITWRNGFDTANPINALSNTAYETSDTNCRAAALTVSGANSTLLFFGMVHDSADTVTFGTPNNPASGITWTERVDTISIGDSRFGRAIYDGVWTGSGSTGTIDSTMSHTKTQKHAFAVALNPAAAATGNPWHAYAQQ